VSELYLFFGGVTRQRHLLYERPQVVVTGAPLAHRLVEGGLLRIFLALLPS
jgi:hypothetical protein